MIKVTRNIQNLHFCVSTELRVLKNAFREKRIHTHTQKEIYKERKIDRHRKRWGRGGPVIFKQMGL